MARVTRARGSASSAQFADSLVAVFYRVAVAGVIVAIGLGILNVARASDLDGSVFDAALAMPTVSFESAYEMEARALLESFMNVGEISPVSLPAPQDRGADSSSSEGST